MFLRSIYCHFFKVEQEKSLAATHIEAVMDRTRPGRCQLKWHAIMKEGKSHDSKKNQPENEIQEQSGEEEEVEEVEEEGEEEKRDLVYIKEKKGFDKYVVGALVMEHELWLGNFE